MTSRFETNNIAIRENDRHLDEVMGQMLAGICHLHCTAAEEMESDNHVAVAYQKVRQILQKDESWSSFVE